MKAITLALSLTLLLLPACSGGDETDSAADSTPGPATSEPVESASPPAEDPGAGTQAREVSDLVSEIEECLNSGGIETAVEQGELPTYDEKATISLTFVYPQIKVPDAVTLWVYESPEAAAKGKKEIDKDLLEGDTETLLRGQVVVDDFGNTLETPEAQEQASILDSCTVAS
ncbi:MAG: hypothetical protein M3198_09725 [Actinomycetota bacterium]|nr:hypothetical protein [Actinomycetota bacterium]